MSGSQALQVATCDLSTDPEAAVAAQCTPKQEAFARALFETGNAAAAYRVAYEVHPHHSRNWVFVNAHRCRSLPQVRARLEQLQGEAAARSIMSRDELIRRLCLQIAVDPNELVSLHRYACRHCNGIDGGYQWKDEDEFTAAYVATLDANACMLPGKRKLKLPSDAGGFGYRKGLDPNPLCAECLGSGTAESIIKDTSKLTGGALMLYAGVKETAAGTVLLMHDKTKIVEQLCKLMGWNKDALPPGVTPPGQGPLATLPATMTEGDAAKHYLRLVGGVA